MKKMNFFIMLLSAMLLFTLSFAMAGEEEVLKALEKVKAATETGVNYNKYCELLANAGAEINILKRSKKDWKKDEFTLAVVRCLFSYETAKIGWETIINHGSNPSTKARIQKSWKMATEHLDKAYRCLE
jgi:hypothetical protein